MIELIKHDQHERVFSDEHHQLQSELNNNFNSNMNIIINNTQTQEINPILDSVNHVLDSINLNFEGPLLGKSSLNEQSTLEEGIQKIEMKMRELNLFHIGTNELFLLELRQLLREINHDKSLETTFSHLLCLFLSFYGNWREAESIMKRWGSSKSLPFYDSVSSKDIYTYTVEALDSQEVMSSILLLFCCSSPSQSSHLTAPKAIDTFKEYLFFAVIDTFNLRMQSISKDVFEWLIQNEKFRLLEQLIENGRISASHRSTMEHKRIQQEHLMFEYLHREYVTNRAVKNMKSTEKSNANNTQSSSSSGEIELLINFNENDLHFLSMEYARFLEKKNWCRFRFYLNRQLIERTIQKQNVYLFSVFYRANPKGTSDLLHSKIVFCTIQAFLSSAATFAMGLYFLKKIAKKDNNRPQSPDQLKCILKLLLRPYDNEQFGVDIFAYTLHPIVLCIVASKILLKLSKTINPFSTEMLKLSKFYLNRALLYRDTISDAREMSIVLFKPLFPSDKPLIKALRSSKYREFFVEFLSHPCITFLLEQKWMSSYGWNSLMFVAFTPASHALGLAKIKDKPSKMSRTLDSTGQLQSVDSNPSQQLSTGGTSSQMSSSGGRSRKQTWNIFSVIQTSSLEKLAKNNYMYQYKIFTKSVAVRTSFEFIIFLIIFILTVYYLFRFIQNQNDFEVLDEQIKELLFNQVFPQQFYAGIIEYSKKNPELGFKSQSEYYGLSDFPPKELCEKILIRMGFGYPEFISYFQSDCELLVEQGLLFEEFTVKTTIVCIVILSLGINVILKQIYSFLLSKKLSINVLDIYDMIITIVSFFYLQVKVVYLYHGITGYKLDYFEYYTSILKTIGAILVFLLWIRLILFLIRSQKIGILVRIIILFMYDLSQFSIVLMLVLFAFAMLCYILFQKDVAIYATFQSSFFNLVGAMYGAFDFSEQTLLQSMFLIVFLFLVNIVMFNLLVAILNTRYEKTMKRSNMDYSLVVYDDYLKMRFSPFYSCLISLPPPFNIVNVISGTIAIIVRSRKWNSIVLKFNYIVFILLPISMLFLSVSIAFLPIGYLGLLKSLSFYSGQDNMINGRKKSVAYRAAIGLFRVMTWIILGLPFLIFTLIFNDFPLFFKSAFINKNNRYTFTKNLILDIRVIQYASINNHHLHTARAEILNYLTFRESLEPMKKEKLNQCLVFNGDTKIIGQTMQQCNPHLNLTTSKKHKETSRAEKDFEDALKKFGEGSQKQENINLNHLLKSIKLSIIFFNSSKNTSSNVSRLLYLVKKKEQFSKLLHQTDKNFFLNRTFSSVSDAIPQK